MTLTIIFLLSGAFIAFLLVAKRLEEKRKRSFILFQAISKGDHQVRELTHSAAHLYDVLKVKAQFFFLKQVPMRSRSIWNKFSAKMNMMIDKYLNDIRGSKLLKKQEGISEFFQNLSSVEKGEGQIEQVNFDHYEEPADEVESR